MVTHSSQERSLRHRGKPCPGIFRYLWSVPFLAAESCHPRSRSNVSSLPNFRFSFLPPTPVPLTVQQQYRERSRQRENH